MAAYNTRVKIFIDSKANADADNQGEDGLGGLDSGITTITRTTTASGTSVEGGVGGGGGY